MTTLQVAVRLGISRIEILTLVNRHPHLRPEKIDARGYLWSEIEIQTLQAHLAALKRSERRKINR